MDLRTLTRDTEQARSSQHTDEYYEAARPLAEKQKGLDTRTANVIDAIEKLPDGETEFAKEIAQLGNAKKAMGDAHKRLVKPDTGRSEERRVGKECRSRWSP